MLFLILLLIGLFGGLIAGLLGVGGGIIFTPVLFFLFDGQVENPVVWTIATSLLCTFFAAIGSSRKHYVMGNLFLAESLKVGLFGFLGTFAGKMITTSAWYSKEYFVVLFSTILGYTSYTFIKGKKNKSFDSVEYNKETAGSINWAQALLVGGAGGFIATLAGVGGGIVMVPLMVMIAGIHFRKAVSVSSVVIILISFSAWVQFAFEPVSGESLTRFTSGFVDFGTALPLIAGALLGSGGGVWLTGKIARRKLEVAFALLAIVIMIRLLAGIM